MADFSKRAPNASLYFFEAAQLDAGTFQVVRFEGTEQISRPFAFELQLLSEDPDIEFDKVVDKPATFTMMRGDEEAPVHGIVTNFSLHGRTADHVVYEATLRPRLWRLGLSKRSRIFQEMKVEDILRTVFKEDGLSPSAFKFKLKGAYSPREYCVQYQETDLNFVSRLMEFEGMCYFFDHGEGEETLIVTDKKSEHEKIASPSSISYYTGAEGMDRDEEIVRQLKRQEQVVTGKVKLKDYDYRTADTLSAESQVDEDMPGTRYEYGEHYRDTERGKRLAKVRNEEIEAQHRTVQTESDCMGLRSGHLFTLENHFRKSLNQDYLVTKVEHEGSQRAGLDIGSARESEEPTYRNSAECIPASVQYRPPRDTPKPEVSGVLTAKIESAGGDYAYIDDQGQYRAEMHFDEREGRSEGTKTLPVRMAQPYSGSDYGMHFPNHAGTEVILAFENGDIDRPVALGTAPNSSNKSPAVSENKMENVIRTWAKNELKFDDSKDEENIIIKAEKDHTVKVKNNGYFSIKNNLDILVKNNRKSVIKEGDDKLIVKKGDRTKIVEEGDLKISVNMGDKKITIKEGNYVLNVDVGDRMINIKEGDDILNVNMGDKTINIKEGDYVLNVDTGNKTINVKTGDNVLNVNTGDRIVNVKAGDDVLNVDAGSRTVNVQQKMKLKCGQSVIKLEPTKITIKSPSVNIN